MVKLWSYNENSARNANAVKIGKLTLYFSYETIVAFREEGHLEVVCENVWSSTTGKHLNWIDGGDKAGRVPSEEFQAKLHEVLKKYNLE